MTTENLNILVELFAQLTILALITEGVTEVIKDLLPEKLRVNLPTRLISIGVAMGVAVGWGIDITILLNHKVDFAGSILTGVIGSRGANFTNDLTAKLKQIKG